MIYTSGAQQFSPMGQKSGARLVHGLDQTLRARIGPSHPDWTLRLLKSGSRASRHLGLISRARRGPYAAPTQPHVLGSGLCATSFQSLVLGWGHRTLCCLQLAPQAEIRALGPTSPLPSPVCWDSGPRALCCPAQRCVLGPAPHPSSPASWKQGLGPCTTSIPCAWTGAHLPGLCLVSPACCTCFEPLTSNPIPVLFE